MRGSAASLPGRRADCCRKIGTGARDTPVGGSRTQSSLRRRRDQEVATRRSEFAAILKNDGMARSAQPQDRYSYRDFGKVLPGRRTEIAPQSVPAPVPAASSSGKLSPGRCTTKPVQRDDCPPGPGCNRFTEGFGVAALKAAKYSWHRRGRLLTTRSPSAAAG